MTATTTTVLARNLQVGDVLVSAALGGVWNATIMGLRPMGLEVLIRLTDETVCLERNEVCEVRAILSVDLDPENSCAQCGAPTIRGLNTDFCSEACEKAFDAEHPSLACTSEVNAHS